MHFADIKNDIAFRKIFGNDSKKEILISFLNAVLKLEGNHKIVWVEVVNPYQVPIVLGAKSTILDVKAKDERGNEYIVEMQLTDKLGFAKRVVYYSAKSYSAQLSVGEDYHTLKPTIFIGIVNFEFLATPHYLSRHLILDSATHEHKLKDLEFNFIELPKFTKTESELTNLTDKWVYFIKNASSLSDIPANIDDAGLKAAFGEAERHRWTKADVEAYEYAFLRESDDRAEKLLAVQKRSIEIAKKLINRNLTNEEIAEDTGLNPEQIEQLRRE